MITKKKEIIIALIIILIITAIGLVISVYRLNKRIVVTNEQFIINNNYVNGYHTNLTSTFNGVNEELAYVETASGFGSAIAYSQKDNTVYFITANHNIGNNENIILMLANGNRYNAKIVGRDDFLDIAVLSIDVDFKVPVIKLGDSSILKTAEYVIAAGAYNNKDFVGSLTIGIVSTGKRTIIKNIDDKKYYITYIQSDVKVDSGMSGGPLYNMNKELVGINVLKNVGEINYCLSIPINEAKIAINQIILNGSVNRNVYNIKAREISEIKTYEKTELNLTLNNSEGIYVIDVLSNGLANDLGIIKGDTILSINNKKINTIDDLLKLDYQEYEKYYVEIIRDQKNMVLESELSN